jgi:predicted kinase
MDVDGWVEVVLLTGPSGVGKTSVAYEMSARLKAGSISHALIDTDELDRVYPRPPDEEGLSRRTLQAVWEEFAMLGCRRLILCSVLAHAVEVPGWIKQSLGGQAEIHTFRLNASIQVVRERLARREIGSLLEEHVAASEAAQVDIERTPSLFRPVETEGRSVTKIANEILKLAGWV